MVLPFFPNLLAAETISSKGAWLDFYTNVLLGTVLGSLIAAYFVGRALRQAPESTANPAVVRTFNLRVRAWWMMCAILLAGFLLGYEATIVLFGLVSFWALREFITMTPTRRGDHRTLFWTFFLFTPLQYFLVGMGDNWFEIYTTMIPVYASLFIPARIAISGDPKRFLERVAKIQAALLICVYALSHAPALLHLNLATSAVVAEANRAESKAKQNKKEQNKTEQTKPEIQAESTTPPETAPPVEPTTQPVKKTYRGSPAGLLFYFVLIVQLNDIFQYGWGQLLGRHLIAPAINSNRTWEGFIGGSLSTMLLGALLWWATPFQIWEAACMALVVAISGSAGGLTMSAIKRDRGVKDYGTLVSGHAGLLDRIDSICFAAPVFFHLTRHFFALPPG